MTKVRSARHRETSSPPLERSNDWSFSGERWLSGGEIANSKVARSQQSSSPLILTGHGMHLCINGGALEVRNGFSHYPQKQEKWRFFRGDQDLPTRIVVLDGNGAITFDVLAWLSEQNIPLIQLDYRGNVVMAIGANCIGGDPSLLHKQVAASHCPEHSMAVSTWFVRQKLIASLKTLTLVAPDNEQRAKAEKVISAEIERLGSPWAGFKAALLGIEGKCAEVYFTAWREIQLSWMGTARKPIPDRWRVVGPRATRKGRNNRAATHPVQAMLNYGYAIAESQLRLETSRIGLDPATGFLHQSQAYRAALILDLIELLRPAVDGRVLQFAQQERFSASDFTIGSAGACRLHPQLARRLVTEIEVIRETNQAVLGLLAQLKHGIPTAIPHRSRAWLAQRVLLSGKNASLDTS